MNWKQRFGRARKTGTISAADLKIAKSWRHCAVGVMLHNRGYNRIHTSQQLGHIVLSYDDKLNTMGCRLFGTLDESNAMPQRKETYESEDEYRKECMRLVDDAEKAYDEIQNTEPSQALIDCLNLKATPVASA